MTATSTQLSAAHCLIQNLFLWPLGSSMGESAGTLVGEARLKGPGMR
jgi:hypothetical protein